MHMIKRFLSAITYKPLVNLITTLLLGKEIETRLLDCILNPVKNPLSYDFKWSFKNFWDSYNDLVEKHMKLKFESGKPKEEVIAEKADLIQPDSNKKKGKSQNFIFSKLKGFKKRFFNTASYTASYLDFRSYFKNDVLKYENEHNKASE